jgi:hypothetical protein
VSIWIRLILALIILFGVALGAAVLIGKTRWNGSISQMIERLTAADHPRVAKKVSFGSLKGLPAPVVRYFQMALREGMPPVRAARIAHRGEFLTSQENDGWSPFTSTQHYSVQPPGFVWDASIRMSSLVTMRVLDSYLEGKGAMEARAAALVPVMNQRDKAELNEGALMRYLAEAVWFPTALLPEYGVVWTAIDDSRARAALEDSGIRVSLEFSFNEKGEVVRIYSAGRGRETNGKFEPTPWVVQVRAYEERGGMRIPMEGEVAWALPGGVMSYWKGRITETHYEFMQ